MKTIQICAVILFVIFSLSSAFAQNEEKDLSKGVTIYLFNGLAAGYRFNECDNSFWRINLNLSEFWIDRKDNSDGWHWSTTPSDTTSFEGEYEDNRFGIAISPQYLYKFYDSKFITFYTGGGISVGYGGQKTRAKDNNIRQTVSADYHYDSEHHFSIGLISILGIESKPVHNISIFAESQLGVSRMWANYDLNTSYSPGNETTTRQYYDGRYVSWYGRLIFIRAGVTIKF
jgi:hypothetical protein